MRSIKANVKLICTGLLLVFSNDAAAYTTLVASSDSDAFAEAEFTKVLAEGGTITFEAGAWTINPDSSHYEALGDVTIVGANTVDAADPDYRGAYEGLHLKTSITMTGYAMQIKPDYRNLTIRNIQWIRTGIQVDGRHQPAVDFDNVLFDISSWSKSLWAKVVIATNDGIAGDIMHTTFRGFGASTLNILKIRI